MGVGGFRVNGQVDRWLTVKVEWRLYHEADEM